MVRHNSTALQTRVVNALPANVATKEKRDSFRSSLSDKTAFGQDFAQSGHRIITLEPSRHRVRSPSRALCCPGCWLAEGRALHRQRFHRCAPQLATSSKY